MFIDEKCDICGKDAVWDGPTQMGPWGYMCDDCMKKHGYITFKGNIKLKRSDGKTTKLDVPTSEQKIPYNMLDKFEYNGKDYVLKSGVSKMNLLGQK